MRKAVAALALALTAFAVGACGSSSSEDSSTSGAGAGAVDSVVTIEAVTGPTVITRFTSKKASTEAGRVKIRFVDPQDPQAVREDSYGKTHGLVLEDSRGGTVGETQLIHEGSDSFTVELKPGKYTYYCPLPGHRFTGMKGTLTVN